MQTSPDLKYFRDAISLLLDKLLPYIDHKTIQQFCRGLKLKVDDDKVSPFSIYMETQKNFEGSQVKLCKVQSGTQDKLATTLLQKIKFAQLEFKNNSQQFASVFNSVKENVQSLYMSSEQLQTMIKERDLENKNEQRQEKIRRVSIYNKLDKRNDEKQNLQENKIEQKIEQKYDIKNENNTKIENNIQQKIDIKQEYKFDSKLEQKFDYKQEQKFDSKQEQKYDSKQEQKFDSKLEIKYDPFVDSNKKETISYQDSQKITKTYSGSQNYLKYNNSPNQIQMPSISQNNFQHKSSNPSPNISYNYIQTPPHSYNQLSTQTNSQVSSFNHSPQQPLYNQININQQQQNDVKIQQQQLQQQQQQIGSYVPNYDLLARVDQLLQKSKNSTQIIQVQQPCLINRT